MDLDYLIHTFAPTSNFKCCCDACGADTKKWYKKQEMLEVNDTRCSNSLELFLLFANKMPQPGGSNQARQDQLMKLHHRYHRYVCTPKDYNKTKAEMIGSQNSNLIKDIVVVDDDEFYGASKTKTLDGITKMHQLVFRKKDPNNPSQLCVHARLASCYCINCRTFNFKECLLIEEKGRNFMQKQILDQGSSSVLDFFGKHSIITKSNNGKEVEQRRLMTSEQWKKLADDKVVVVGIDTGKGDIQLARMIDCPKKWNEEDREISFPIGNKVFSTLLLNDTYYFPVQLLAKLDMQRTNMKPNCYLQMDQTYNIPLHCIIPPYLEKSSSQSADDGKSTKTFWNYIQCSLLDINCRGIGQCIQIDHNYLRMLKNNTVDKNK